MRIAVPLCGIRGILGVLDGANRRAIFADDYGWRGGVLFPAPISLKGKRMARARSIKPGFFTNEKLAELNPLARILFAGLWTIADRSGRLEDRPKRIQSLILPYDRCKIEPLLRSLEEAGFILRYELGGNRYISIPTWNRHQNPHVREPASTIPAPVEHSARHVSGPADSLNPVPHSLNPEPCNAGPVLQADGFGKLLAEWQKPCEHCGVEFPCNQIELGYAAWQRLVDQGRITSDTLPEILEGLRRHRESTLWHKNNGQYVMAVSTFLGYQNNGLPAAPRWTDRPAREEFYDLETHSKATS